MFVDVGYFTDSGVIKASQLEEVLIKHLRTLNDWSV